MFPSVIGTAYTIYTTGTTRNLEGTFRLLATMTAEVPERDQEETGGADVMDPSPVNDLCENAVHLIVDDTGEPIWGTVSGATNNDNNVRCEVGPGDDGRSDRSNVGWDERRESSGVYYSFTGTGDLLVVSTCFEDDSTTTTTMTNTDLHVRLDGCDGECISSLTTVRYGSSACAVGVNSVGSNFVVESVEGIEYSMLVVADAGGIRTRGNGDALNWVLTVVHPSGRGSFGGDNGAGDLTGGVNGVWYSVQGTGAFMVISTCSAATDFDAGIVLRENGCGGDCILDDSILDNILGSSCEDVGVRGREFAFESVVGVNYRILVAGDTSGITGTFGISAREVPETPGE